MCRTNHCCNLLVLPLLQSPSDLAFGQAEARRLLTHLIQQRLWWVTAYVQTRAWQRCTCWTGLHATQQVCACHVDMLT